VAAGLQVFGQAKAVGHRAIYPAISLKDARDRRTEAKRLLVDNIDPSTAKQSAKAAATEAAKSSFEIVCREWIKSYSNNWAAS